MSKVTLLLGLLCLPLLSNMALADDNTQLATQCFALYGSAASSIQQNAVQDAPILDACVKQNICTKISDLSFAAGMSVSDCSAKLATYDFKANYYNLMAQAGGALPLSAPDENNPDNTDSNSNSSGGLGATDSNNNGGVLPPQSSANDGNTQSKGKSSINWF